ncbi:MAG: hypothetical protein KDA41_06785, partial [Planctomycetales bacterium]|nr:hypothetical protein [Planctomycetales bacterium]
EAMKSGGDVAPAKTKPVLEVEFELAGDEATVRAAFAGGKIADCKATPTGRLRLTTVLGDQADVDAAVDRLRAAGVSVVRLTPRRATLEDVFLDAVRDKKGEH